MIYSINIEKISKADWIDNNWNLYQNINLINFKNDLYLIGLCKNSKKEDIADLFSLKEVTSSNFYLTIMDTKTFKCRKEVSFIAGTGVVIGVAGEMGIISCP